MIVLQVLSFFILLCYVDAQCANTIKVGSQGECVKVVQRAVGTNPDGIFGEETKSAVMRFQRQHDLTADGIVGRQTWEKIYGGSNTGGAGNNGANGCGCGYDRATSGCSGGPTQGARNMADYLERNFGGKTEIYNCRKIEGSSNWSLHSEGRAVDIYLTKSTGDRVFNHLKDIACSNGIQEVIWWNQIWTSGKGVHPYNGQNPHKDHVHVGLNRCGARSFSL